MKKIFLLLTVFLMTMTAMTSCQDPDEFAPSKDALVISFDGDDGGTKAGVSPTSPDGGGSAALYSKSTGALKANGSYTGNTRSVTISNPPSEACWVVAVANTGDFSWPSNMSGLSSKTVTINHSANYYPSSTGTQEYEYAIGVTHITVRPKALVAKIRIMTGELLDVQAPNTLSPFGTASSNTVNNNYSQVVGESNSYWVPSGVAATVKVSTDRYSNTHGWDYYDRYNVAMTSLPRFDSKETVTYNPITVVNGANKTSENYNQTLDGRTEQDMRQVEFSPSEVTVYSLIEGQTTLTVSTQYPNTDTDWQGRLWWSNFNMDPRVVLIKANNQIYNLNDNGYVDLPPGTYTIKLSTSANVNAAKEIHASKGQTSDDDASADVNFSSQLNISGLTIEPLTVSGGYITNSGNYFAQQSQWTFKATATVADVMNYTISNVGTNAMPDLFEWWWTSDDQPGQKMAANRAEGSESTSNAFAFQQNDRSFTGEITIHCRCGSQTATCTLNLENYRYSYAPYSKSGFSGQGAQLQDISTQADISAGLYKYRALVYVDSWVGPVHASRDQMVATVKGIDPDPILTIEDLVIGVVLKDDIDNGPVSSYPAPYSRKPYIHIDFVEASAITNSSGNYDDTYGNYVY